MVLRQREQRGGHGDPRRGAILGRGPLRHVHVHEGGVEEVGVGAVLGQVAQHVAVGDVRRLLHHLTELAGELEAAGEGVHLARLDGQGRPAHGGPGQAGDHPLPLEHLLLAEERRPQVLLEVLHRDLHRLLVVLQQLHRRLAHDAVQLLLELAHACLPGVALDHLA